MQELLGTMPESREDERTIVSTRLLHAPRSMVFSAFADPEQVVECWGPHGFTTAVLEMDLRPGGKRRIVMHGPDGANYPNEMRFTRVVPNECVEPDFVGSKEHADAVHLHNTITWRDEDGKPRLTLRNEFGSRELRDQNVRAYQSVQGARDLFERLTAFLVGKGVSA